MMHDLHLALLKISVGKVDLFCSIYISISAQPNRRMYGLFFFAFAIAKSRFISCDRNLSLLRRMYRSCPCEWKCVNGGSWWALVVGIESPRPRGLLLGGDLASWGFRGGTVLNINCKDVCSRNHIILPFDPMRWPLYRITHRQFEDNNLACYIYKDSPVLSFI